MVKPVSALTRAVVVPNIHRKAANLLSFLVDTSNCNAYVIPHEREHADVAAEILGLSDVSELQANPQRLAELVPSTLEFDPSGQEVVGIITGVSGLEMGFGARHSAQQLELTHAIVKKVIDTGDFIPNLKTDKIVRKFQTKV